MAFNEAPHTRAQLLRALSHLAGVSITSVYRSPPKHVWPPEPKGSPSQQQAWLITTPTLARWAQSSSTFRDPKLCAAFFTALGASFPVGSGLSRRDTKQILSLLHAIAGDTNPSTRGNNQP